MSDRRIRVGVDLVDVGRLTALLDSHAAAAPRLFTPGELATCAGSRRGPERLAARFAAKEAVLKAFGTGLSRGMRWTDVEVCAPDPSGRPVVELRGAAAAFGRRGGLEEIDVSLSHTAGLAIAQAVTLWRREPADARGAGA